MERGWNDLRKNQRFSSDTRNERLKKIGTQDSCI